jgi:transcriptional regulator with XRE-family HTH domain
MNETNNNFGNFIKELRENKHLTLRAVEDETGISNAYLSQLEKGKIKKPSPAILYKLAELYQVSYADLFNLVGYPQLEQTDSLSPNSLANRIGPITPEEENELVDYLEFLRMRRRKNK